MKRITIYLLSAVFALPLCLSSRDACLAENAAPTAKPAEDTVELKAFQGEWIPVKAELAGQPMPDAVLKTISLKLTKNDYEALVAGKSDKGTWTFDAAAKPKSMTITGVKGPNAGKTFPAIYELTPDTLRVCYDLSGKKLPTEFKTKPDTKLYLVTYKRKKV